MAKYITKRILIMIPVFFGMTALVFFLSQLTPGSPVDAMITPEMNAADIQMLEARLGLDKPIYIQYIRWLGRLFQGDLGFSYRTSQAVISNIGGTRDADAHADADCTGGGSAGGVTLGVLAACKPYSVWDTIGLRPVLYRFRHAGLLHRSGIHLYFLCKAGMAANRRDVYKCNYAVAG